MTLLDLKRIIIGTVLFLGFTLPVSAHLRVTHSNAVSIEVLGRTVLYGLQWDRSLTEQISAGVSLSHVSVSGDSASSAVGSTWILPVFGNYYFSSEPSSIFATAGLSLLSRTQGFEGRQLILGGAEITSFPIWTTVGAGYEIRQPSGFLFRVNGLLTVSGAVSTSFGLNLGHCF